MIASFLIQWGKISTPKMHNQKGTTAACILQKNLEMEEQTISWIFFIINTAWVSSFQWPPINILLQFLSMTSITFATFISYFRSGTVKMKLYGSLTSEVHNLYRKQQPYEFQNIHSNFSLHSKRQLPSFFFFYSWHHNYKTRTNFERKKER